MTKQTFWQIVTTTILVVLLVVVVMGYGTQLTENAWLRHSNSVLGAKLEKDVQMVTDLRLEVIKLRQYRSFDTVEEMTQWVSQWNANQKPIVAEFFGLQIGLRNGEKYSAYYDCDDFAEAMQRDALKDGFLISVCLIDSTGKLHGVPVTAANHAGCITVTENYYWFIEPQTGEMIKLIMRDKGA
jgi:hypothetical protein